MSAPSLEHQAAYCAAASRMAARRGFVALAESYAMEAGDLLAKAAEERQARQARQAARGAARKVNP